MTAEAGVPLPDTSYAEFAPYWAATREGSLMVQCCSECGEFRWPPRPACAQCCAVGGDWREIARTAFLYSWTEIGHAASPAFAKAVPYTVVVVESSADSRIRFVGNLTQTGGVSLEVGMAMRAVFRKVDDLVTLVDWTPDA